MGHEKLADLQSYFPSSLPYIFEYMAKVTHFDITLFYKDVNKKNVTIFYIMATLMKLSFYFAAISFDHYIGVIFF